MADQEQTEPQASPEIERGAYEVIRERLVARAKELQQKTDSLNERRVELFGRTEFELLGTERLRTANNCVPRDVVQVGGRLLFGYNVHIGLRTETRVDDVFSLHRFEAEENGFRFEEIQQGPERAFLDDEAFVRDFKELYQYYKSARLLQLRQLETKLLAAFQIGAQLSDIKVFRWDVDGDGLASYRDNRGERDHAFPAPHDFEWTQTTRENHVQGRFPHVSILDEVFVETVGGDLTIKIENNTDAGLGIYAEPVEDERQSLDDAEIHYAKVGPLIIIKVLPYREREFRYFVFNTLTHGVERIDAIGQACLQLPEDHGLVFPGGYYLRSGHKKLFDGDWTSLEFQRQVRAPNGEDVLYVFHERAEGRSVLLPYNLIRKEVRNPVPCHGFSRFADGRMVVLRAQSEEPTRVHPMQTWQTPFCSEEHAAEAPEVEGDLGKIGNTELVRGISEALSLVRMTNDVEPTREVYEELISTAQRMLDAYYWLDSPDASGMNESVESIRETAEKVIDEFEKVEAIRRSTRGRVAEAAGNVQELLRTLDPEAWKSVPPFVDALVELRRQRGMVITLRDLRYVDRAALDGLEARVVEAFDKVAAGATDFLATEEALQPYHAEIAALEEASEAVATVHELQPQLEGLNDLAGKLDALSEIVTGIEIDDATVRTRILEGISEVLGGLNRARAVVEGRRKQLRSGEAVAEFGVQFQLFSQSVTSALAMADSPERCDEQLSRLMLQLEELEGRFGEFDDFLLQLQTKREEVYEAVSSKKQLLLDQRQRRSDALVEAAERILSSITRRTAGIASDDELAAYFAGDAMVAKLRDLVEKLRALGAAVRADELEARLKATRTDASRSLRDREDLYEEGAEVIRLGKHRFAVNTRRLDLTLVPRGDGMSLHLTGTEFYEPFDDPEFEKTKDLWSQELVSETTDVYRGEYLAAEILAAAEEERDGLTLSLLLEKSHDKASGELLELVRKYASERYDEGYERGVHDADTALILQKLLGIYATADLLRFAPRPRAFASLFWSQLGDRTLRESWQRRARSLGRMRASFAHSPAIDAFTLELARAIGAFCEERAIALDPQDTRVAGSYLFEELGRDPMRFTVSAEAVQLRDAFFEQLAADGSRRELEHDIRELQGDLKNLYSLVEAWVAAFVDRTERPEIADFRPALEGAAVLIVADERLDRDTSSALPKVSVAGLLGHHGRINDRSLSLRLDEFLSRLGRFRHERVPAFRAFQELRHSLLERERRRLRITEFEPRVMSSFVRNRLIDEVYLPIIGDNLAKQIGATGEGKRTDLMGLLLLISPPGYGKTTLMEYIANRLGMVFMKINGPALGHSVTSLDPAAAGNATARQEVDKINLALEMGSNVLLYLDDIQHTHPELLQKFISLCDAQRRIEGVWRDHTRTYDLKGKRFYVCMAGNPYTESGEKFQIPDMLANRADVYNLGEVLEGKDDLFALSYLENALTSSATLAPLTTRDHDDIHKLVGLAKNDGTTPDQLSHPYSAPELEEIVSVLRKLMSVQEVVLTVNRQYILSASQEDAFRTEPRFQLQGSYRNMNKLAEKTVAVMNDDELEALVDDHYLGESQTLTTGAEHNLLKLAELRGRMSDEQKLRWTEIKRTYARIQTTGGDDDPVTRVTGQLGLMSDRLADIAARIATAVTDGGSAAGRQDLGASLLPVLEKMQQAGVGTPRETGLSPEAVSVITTHLGELSAKLGAIGAAIDDAASRAPAAAEAEAPLQPYLDKLQDAVEAMSAKGGTRREVIQTLPGGVGDLLDDLAQQVSDSVMPALRGISRRIEGSDDKVDRRARTEISKALKQLDQLRDLAGALRRLDTRGIGEES